MNNVSAPYKKLGAWLARSKDTVYQAATDGFVLGYQKTVDVVGYTDISNPPTTIRASNYCFDAAHFVDICMPVRKGDYWKIINASPVFWISLEP